MKKFNQLIFIIISAALLLASCQMESKTSPSSQSDEYSLLLEMVNEKSAAESVLQKFQNKIEDSLYLITNAGINEVPFFQIRAGKYKSSIQAGLKGLSYVLDSLIHNYRILKRDSLVFDLSRDFYFVAKYLNRPSLYKLNLINKKIELVWSRWGKRIISLNYKSDQNTGFFTTALTYGKNTGFPHIRRANLYIFDREKNRIRWLRGIGDAIQISTEWEDVLFKVIITKFDLKNSSIIYETSIQYNLKGKLVSENTVIYNLRAGEYPENAKNRIVTISPDSLKKVEIARIENKTIVDLREFDTGNLSRLMETENLIDRIEWAPDGSSIFIRSREKADSVASDNYEITVLNLESGPPKSEIKSYGLANFKIIGRLLIYEDGIGTNSSIIFFDYKRGKPYYSISAAGGCGIYNIPFLVY